MPIVGVIGATGRQGLAQITQLRHAGYDVRAFSRRENPSFFGIDGAVESRILDLEDEATLLPALQSRWRLPHCPQHLQLDTGQAGRSA